MLVSRAAPPAGLPPAGDAPVFVLPPRRRLLLPRLTVMPVAVCRRRPRLSPGEALGRQTGLKGLPPWQRPAPGLLLRIPIPPPKAAAAVTRGPASRVVRQRPCSHLVHAVVRRSIALAVAGARHAGPHWRHERAVVSWCAVWYPRLRGLLSATAAAAVCAAGVMPLLQCVLQRRAARALDRPAAEYLLLPGWCRPSSRLCIVTQPIQRFTAASPSRGIRARGVGLSSLLLACFAAVLIKS